MFSKVAAQFAALVLSISLCSSSSICPYGNVNKGDYPCSDFDRFMPILPLNDYRKMLELLMNRQFMFGEPGIKPYSPSSSRGASIRRTIQTILMKKPSSEAKYSL